MDEVRRLPQPVAKPEPCPIDALTTLTRPTQLTVIAALAASACLAGLVFVADCSRGASVFTERHAPLDRIDGIWISRKEIMQLPTSGPAWDRMIEEASQSTRSPNLSDQNDMTNVRVLAKALAFVRTGKASYRDDVIAACLKAIGTEQGGRTLSLGRELAAYVIAADLVELPDPENTRFESWLRTVLSVELEGRTLRSTQEKRPNNWGNHAAASRIAVALYLRDGVELQKAARVFKGYLGDRDAYADFAFGALDWQSDPRHPVGINPPGARLDGHDVDGVLPDDQRRCCDRFTWPAPKENYVYEALQGALAAAVMLDRAGYDVWNWQERALLRAFRWLHGVNAFPAVGDDTWQPYLVNYYYHTDFPTELPTRAGKNVGFTDWTHGTGRVRKER
jgi:Alginate lyase